MGEALSPKFAVPDADLFETFDAPEMAVLAHGAKIDGSDPERLRANLAVPPVETSEVQIWVAIRQTPRLDWIGIIYEEQEDVTVAVYCPW